MGTSSAPAKQSTSTTRRKKKTNVIKFVIPGGDKKSKLQKKLVEGDKRMKAAEARVTGDKAALAAHLLSHTQQITLKQVSLADNQTIFCGRDRVYALNLRFVHALVKVKVTFRTMRCLWYAGLLTCPNNNTFVLTALGRKAAALVEVDDDMALGLLQERDWESNFKSYALERGKKNTAKKFVPKKKRTARNHR